MALSSPRTSSALMPRAMLGTLQQALAVAQLVIIVGWGMESREKCAALLSCSHLQDPRPAISSPGSSSCLHDARLQVAPSACLALEGPLRGA